MPQDDIKGNSEPVKELGLDEKIEELVKLYTEYEEEVTRLHEEFLKKISEVRKKDDLKKLEELSKK